MAFKTQVLKICTEDISFKWVFFYVLLNDYLYRNDFSCNTYREIIILWPIDSGMLKFCHALYI